MNYLSNCVNNKWWQFNQIILSISMITSYFILLYIYICVLWFLTCFRRMMLYYNITTATCRCNCNRIFRSKLIVEMHVFAANIWVARKLKLAISSIQVFILMANIRPPPPPILWTNSKLWDSLYSFFIILKQNPDNGRQIRESYQEESTFPLLIFTLQRNNRIRPAFTHTSELFLNFFSQLMR